MERWQRHCWELANCLAIHPILFHQTRTAFGPRLSLWPGQALSLPLTNKHNQHWNICWIKEWSGGGETGGQAWPTPWGQDHTIYVHHLKSHWRLLNWRGSVNSPKTKLTFWKLLGCSRAYIYRPSHVISVLFPMPRKEPPSGLSTHHYPQEASQDPSEQILPHLVLQSPSECCSSRLPQHEYIHEGRI